MFLTLEGIEGSGKSTLARHLAAHFAAKGREVTLTREPGGSPLGAALRPLLLHAASRPCARAELFLFLADRAQHVAEIIRPALARGEVVICDRYADSTLVYQGAGRGLAAELAARCHGTRSGIPDNCAAQAEAGSFAQTLFTLNDLAVDGLWPECTLLLDLAPELGLDRARARNAAGGTCLAEGRFEAEELAFHQRVRAGFLELAASQPQRIRVLDATLPPEALTRFALRALEGWSI